MKRIFDVFIVIFISPIVLLICLIIAVIIKINLGSPVFFLQPRPGLNEKIFKMIKFRTMTNEIDNNGNLISDEKRLTKFGNFLRSTSLDEIPGLWNVLSGNMSLVGPRPLLEEYLPLYNIRQKQRHNVKPGITGWAQVNGRNSISWNEKFELDLWYIENQSILLDIKILFLTLKKVFTREGINQENNEIMKKFKGN